MATLLCTSSIVDTQNEGHAISADCFALPFRDITFCETIACIFVCCINATILYQSNYLLLNLINSVMNLTYGYTLMELQTNEIIGLDDDCSIFPPVNIDIDI